jgi:hypothetical protein
MYLGRNLKQNHHAIIATGINKHSNPSHPIDMNVKKNDATTTATKILPIKWLIPVSLDFLCSAATHASVALTLKGDDALGSKAQGIIACTSM